MNQSVEILWNLRIPLRDGVTLAARIYRPRDAAPLPVILTITPYGGDNYHVYAMYFARHGYNFAMVDCRGRGDSEGNFIPEFIDAADGYDAVEWLAAQPWCDGQVGMWGGSYSGENQWYTLQTKPPHLKTIVPAAATCLPVDYGWRGPVRSKYSLQWLALVSGKNASPFNLFGEEQLWIDIYTAHFLSGKAFNELELFFGKKSRHFQEYVQHPPHHPYWEQLRLTPDDYRGFNIPILTIAGQYDDAQRGSLHYLAEHERAGSPAGTQNHFAVIGPWDHSGTRTADRNVGGADFGANCVIDLKKLHLEWYDWVMKKGARPAFLQAQTAY